MSGGLDVVADSIETSAVTDGNPPSDMFSGLALTDTSTPVQGSNDHLAALLAPSPAADPFPQATTPLKAESNVPQQPQPPTGNPIIYPPAMQGMGVMHPYAVPQPAMAGAPFAGQVPLMANQQG